MRTAALPISVLLILLGADLAAAAPPGGGGAAPAARPEAAALCAPPFAQGGATMAPEQARALAAVCPDRDRARRLYHRAHHAELIEDLGKLAQLRKGYDANDRLRLEQSRIFIGLAEAFAGRASAADGSERERAIDALNRAYREAIHRLELTLRGYHRAEPPAASLR